MANPQYIEYLNTIGADIDVNPRPLKPAEPPEKLDKTQLKAHDLPFKIKIDESEWQKVEGVGKFPKNYKPDALDFD